MPNQVDFMRTTVKATKTNGENLWKETSEIPEKLPEGLLPYKEKIVKAVKK